MLHVFRNMFEIPALEILFIRQVALENLRFEYTHKIRFVLFKQNISKTVSNAVSGIFSAIE
jgi:hypothetical protein